MAHSRAFAPLPAFRENSDVITAYAICFNNHKAADLWGVLEWEFFLDDVVTHLAPDSSIWLQFNRELDGTFYTPELKKFFVARGAEVKSS